MKTVKIELFTSGDLNDDILWEISKVQTLADPFSAWATFGPKLTSIILKRSISESSDEVAFVAYIENEIAGFLLISPVSSKGRKSNARYFLIETLRKTKLVSKRNLVLRAIAFGITRMVNRKLIKEHTYEIKSLMVLPRYQSQGVGSRLIQKMLKSVPFSTKRIVVLTNGVRSKDFYLKNCFYTEKSLIFFSEKLFILSFPAHESIKMS